MDDKLVDNLLEQRQVPTAASHPLQFRRREIALTKIVTIGRFQFSHLQARRFPRGLVKWSEPAFDAVGIITARIHPENNGCARVDKLPRDDNFIARAGNDSSGANSGAASPAQRCPQY